MARPRGGARRPGQGQARPPGLNSPGVQQPLPAFAPSDINNAEASQHQSVNLSFGHSTQQQGGAFTFGMPATNTNAGASTFAQPANDTQPQTGTFIFGQSTKDTKEPANTFSFGSSAEDSSQQQNSVTVGQPAKDTQQQAGFPMFGQSTKDTQKQGKMFTFGSPAKENQQANVAKGNQASASFPATGASSSTGFTASAFAPTNASFDFTPAQPQLGFQNPFQEPNPPARTENIYNHGFKGQMFTLKPMPRLKPAMSNRWEGTHSPQWAPMHEGPLNIPIDPRLLADQPPPGTPSNPITSQDLSNQNHAPPTLSPGIHLNASSQPEADKASSSSSRSSNQPEAGEASSSSSRPFSQPEAGEPSSSSSRPSSQPEAGEASSSSSRPLSAYEQLKAKNRECLRQERIEREKRIAARANAATAATETQPQASSNIIGQPELQRQQSSQGPAPSTPMPPADTPLPPASTPMLTHRTPKPMPSTPKSTISTPKPASPLTFAEALQSASQLQGGFLAMPRARNQAQREQTPPSQTQPPSSPNAAMPQPQATGNISGQAHQQQQPTHGQSPNTTTPAETQSQATEGIFARSNPPQPSPTQVHSTRKSANAPSQPTSAVFAHLQQTGTLAPGEEQIPAKDNIFGHLQEPKGPVRLRLNPPKPIVRVADMPMHPVFQTPAWREIYKNSDLFSHDPKYTGEAQPQSNAQPPNKPLDNSNSTSEQQHRPVEKLREQETNNVAAKQTQPPMAGHDAKEQQQKQPAGSALVKLQKSKNSPNNVCGQQSKPAQSTSNPVEQQQTPHQATSSLSGEQQEPKQLTSNAFAQQQEFQQPTNNSFGQQQQTQQPTNDSFGQQHALTKATGNDFGGHQEAQQPTNNILGQREASASYKQSLRTASRAPAAEGQYSLSAAI